MFHKELVKESQVSCAHVIVDICENVSGDMGVGVDGLCGDPDIDPMENLT